MPGIDFHREGPNDLDKATTAQRLWIIWSSYPPHPQQAAQNSQFIVVPLKSLLVSRRVCEGVWRHSDLGLDVFIDSCVWPRSNLLCEMELKHFTWVSPVPSTD